MVSVVINVIYAEPFFATADLIVVAGVRHPYLIFVKKVSVCFSAISFTRHCTVPYPN